MRAQVLAQREDAGERITSDHLLVAITDVRNHRAAAKQESAPESQQRIGAAKQAQPGDGSVGD